MLVLLLAIRALLVVGTGDLSDRRHACVGCVQPIVAAENMNDGACLVQVGLTVRQGSRLGNETVVDPTGPTLLRPAQAVLLHPGFYWRPAKERALTDLHPGHAHTHMPASAATWSNHDRLSYNVLIWATLGSYPVCIMVVTIVLTLLVSLLTTEESKQYVDAETRATSIRVPAARESELTRSSRTLYAWWTFYCRATPLLMLTGMVAVLLALFSSYPREIWSVMLLFTAIITFSNCAHVCVFAPMFFLRMYYAMRTHPFESNDMTIDQMQAASGVVHWILYPNYKEDFEVLCSAIESAAQSAIAREQVCVMLAMEERDETAAQVATRMTAKFLDQFREVSVSYHPQDLPNDPPGKASNVAFAFKKLMQHLVETDQDLSKVVVTISDADSHFHEWYFQLLTKAFLSHDPSARHTKLWQAPMFHIKNYSQQPMMLSVGNMFTALTEMSMLSDPNAVRFPYSTYSLSFNLAKVVDGWDAEWIAEDWHMGLKCFLLTLGSTSVDAIPLPILSYAPLDTTFLGTLSARWSQAKRHALGISDISYYLMTLPLIMARLRHDQPLGICLAAFCKVVFRSLGHFVRMVNTHVMMGHVALYTLLTVILGFVARVFLTLPALRTLTHWETIVTFMFMVAWAVFGATSTVTFVICHRVVKDRIDEVNVPHAMKWTHLLVDRNRIFTHWVYCMLSFFIAGPIYIVVVASAEWIAAVKLSASRIFDYETAIKASTSFSSEDKLESLLRKS
mmetsp:Transcript_13845/g.28962  ORF Transcript_13845/g.28962 Transcript_13845/m.28962 type:complete len:736 (+) Transcript_13845:87-2294(+)